MLVYSSMVRNKITVIQIVATVRMHVCIYVICDRIWENVHTFHSEIHKIRAETNINIHKYSIV